MASKYFSYIFFSFFMLLPSVFSSARNPYKNHFSLSSPAYSPNLRAEKLIRSLNLFPQDTINIAAHDPLLGAPKIVEKQFKFPSLLGTDSNPSTKDLGHHAGYYRLPHATQAWMFYLFFESRNNKNDDPVVLWLTGGPGCSSELAAFYENGPFQITNNLSLAWNDYGWNQVSNLLFVDQPIGTGFSYSLSEDDIRHDEEGVSTDLYDFLQEFLAHHPKFAKNDFYITGESYAGHYIPALASRVHKENKMKEGIHINLKGLAIGNGLTNPEIQYQAYPDYALDTGLITKSDYITIKDLLPDCLRSIRTCETKGGERCSYSKSLCENIFDQIMEIAGPINYYDIRKKCEGSLCYDFSNLEKFLNEKSVKEALGVGNIEFVSCSSTVYYAMEGDWMTNHQIWIPELLEDGIKVLVYAGEYDLICHWLGNSWWVHSMRWSGQQKFGSASNVTFLVDGKEAGLLKSYGPLSFLKVYNAGHLVPMDQPKAALKMLRTWMGNSLK